MGLFVDDCSTGEAVMNAETQGDRLIGEYASATVSKGTLIGYALGGAGQVIFHICKGIIR